MLREQDERDLDRKFTRIETWDEFLARWQVVDTEQEAVGLLYTGTTIQPVRKYVHDDVEKVSLWVNFYLKWTAHENEAVACTAQQLVIKHWLRATPLEAKFVNTHHMLLSFLVEVAEEQSEAMRPAFASPPVLFRPPYPRFVSEYLLKVYEVWCREDKYNPEHHQALLGLTEPFSAALCSWGLAYVLARDYNGKKTMWAIERFLAQRKYDSGSVFFKLSGHGNPIADLSSSNAQDEVNERAALALLKMQYWFGPGVQEKFDRTAIRKH